VIWERKLQLAMQDVLPLRNLKIEISKEVGMSGKTSTTFKTIIWEENNGALKLATMEPGRMTPIPKAYGLRYHWFRSKLKRNEIKVKKIAGVDQRADFLTKGLSTDALVASRKLICGW
jgi:hypothetical protein